MGKYLEDGDAMPFGMYKGWPMKNVPATYLDWLIDQDWIKQWPDVERYILSNEEAINQELEDDV